jgi:hypothetical protein
MGSIADQARKSERKMYRKCKKVKLDSSADADASSTHVDNIVISSADGLSFNYLDKTLEEDVFSARREYKCQQDLGEEMRNKLKLDFNVLYEDADLYDDFDDD